MLNKIITALVLGLIFIGLSLDTSGDKNEKLKKLDLPKPLYTKQDLIKDLDNILSVNEKYSIYVYNLTTQDTIEINSIDKFQAASVTKILVAVNALMKVDKSKFNNEYILNKVSLMINQSNNNAWDILNNMLGFDNLQKFAEANLIEGTYIYDNQMTTRGVGNLLEDIYKDKYLKATTKDFLMNQMTNTNNEEMLPKSVAENVRVIHKTGTYLGNIHDAGIIMSTSPYIIVIFTDDTKGTPAEVRVESIRNAAAKVYQYYTM